MSSLKTNNKINNHISKGSSNKRRRTSKLIKRTEDQIVTKEFKYKIGFNQSVSTGVVALEGYVHFDDGQAVKSTEYLINSLQRFKEDLKHNGYTLATEAAPKRIQNEN